MARARQLWPPDCGMLSAPLTEPSSSCANRVASPLPRGFASVVKDPELTVGARAEALLYAAARAQLVQEALIPLLDRGVWVLLDRFVDSSLAYQGAGRELGIPAIREINQFATDGLTPDRTLLLAIDPALGHARAQHRGEPLDRLEREGQNFWARIQSAYDELAAADPARIRTVDATQDPAKVLADALAAVSDLA